MELYDASDTSLLPIGPPIILNSGDLEFSIGIPDYDFTGSFYDATHDNNSEETTNSASTVVTGFERSICCCLQEKSAAFIIFLVSTGVLANLLGCYDAACNRKKYRHCWNFFHWHVANLCVLFPLALAAGGKFEGYLDFGDTFYKVLSTFFNTGLTASIFQLAYLVFIRCKDIAERKENSTKLVNKIITCAFWFCALAAALPSAFCDDVLGDVVKNESIQQTAERKAYVISYMAISIVVPGIFMLACLAIAFNKKRMNDGCQKTPQSLIEDAREVGVLFVLCYICWSPYCVWRIWVLQQGNVTGQHGPTVIVLCVAIAFSIVMPIVHYGFSRATKYLRHSKVFFPAESQETKQLNVEAV